MKNTNEELSLSRGPELGRIVSEIDSQNRQLIWYAFADGSAESIQVTWHSRYGGSAVRTWSERHEFGTDEAEMIHRLIERQQAKKRGVAA